MPDTLLIVDDEESICKNLGKYFRGKGFDILVAGAAGSQLRLVWETWQWDSPEPQTCPSLLFSLEIRQGI